MIWRPRLAPSRRGPVPEEEAAVAELDIAEIAVIVVHNVRKTFSCFVPRAIGSFRIPGYQFPSFTNGLHGLYGRIARSSWWLRGQTDRQTGARTTNALVRRLVVIIPGETSNLLVSREDAARRGVARRTLDGEQRWYIASRGSVNGAFLTGVLSASRISRMFLRFSVIAAPLEHAHLNKASASFAKRCQRKPRRERSATVCSIDSLETFQTIPSARRFENIQFVASSASFPSQCVECRAWFPNRNPCESRSFQWGHS